MSLALFFLDVSAGFMTTVGWGTLVLLLAIILVLSVAFAAGLAYLLIRIKRRNLG